MERAQKALGPREKGDGGTRPQPGTHVQIVGEDHGGGAVAEGESLGKKAPVSTKPGHIHTSLLQAFPDGGHFLEEDPGPGGRREKPEELCTPP